MRQKAEESLSRWRRNAMLLEESSAQLEAMMNHSEESIKRSRDFFEEYLRDKMD